MSSASYTNGNEGVVHYKGEVQQHSQGNREAAVYFWVAIKEKGGKNPQRREKMDYFVLEAFQLSGVSGQFILNNGLFSWH